MGIEGELAQEVIGDINSIINNVNSYKKLKQETEEINFLNDSIGLTLGEDNELTLND